MEVMIEILARAALNDDFSIVSSQTVTLADEPVTVVPAVPTEAAGQDLRMRLQSPVQQIVQVKRFVTAADGRPSSIGGHGSHGGESQLFPFRGDETSIIMARAGVALP